MMNEIGSNAKVKTFAYRDVFIPQGNVSTLQSEYGVNRTDIETYI